MSRTGRLWGLALVGLAVVVACTDSYLYDPRRDTDVPADRAVALDGRFCTLGANEVRRPIKIIVAMDASQSMRVSDPDGSRATALVDLIDSLPQDDEVSIAVMLFAGSTTAFFTQNPGPPPEDGFVQLSLLDATARAKLTEQLLTFRNTDTSPNRDSTDFVKPLSDIYALINTDIARARLQPNGNEALAQARYSVIFLSDGKPTNNQDDELIRGDAVVRIRQLRDLVEDVRFNTVHVFQPTQPVPSVCDLVAEDGGFGDGGCPLLIINQNADRLEKMASLGGGNFRDFRNNEPINFLNFQFGQVRRAFVVKEVVASNFSAPTGSPLDEADTDGDGLTDAREAELRTNPNLRDTDTDGFSDGVEVYFRDRGVQFDPNQRPLPDGGGLDKGCPPALRGVDTDCDGLLDCDEQFIGTNATLQDSDSDGVPDGMEWRGGTQGASNDLDEDPDTDGLTNRSEARMHTRPLEVDTASLAADAYRYTMEADGPVDADGRQCYRFRVDNVLLAPTLPLIADGGVDGGVDAGTVQRGAGYNDIYLSVSMLPADDTTARTLVRTFRVDSVRYPIGGIKSPPDGVIRVNPEDFVDGCPGVPTLAPAP
ncbi:vWA domain-containing protein [Corallococcus llansteffanensis]|uniref:VWA domain-containing protein n=1 Tax=Corallococcus llansteffanensis TaxID=2316731 RepID=A0A3A8PNS6_9BACT|nr:vWA domain-containing protein [Corallococcus llansteffanensis]RKH56341.1 VWA domain-containing protein [Corallococcus llansteffanensis]